MKNQIARFLKDETGSALDDLLLLALLVATAIFVAAIMGVALAVGVGVIAGGISLLCKLWREGKKGWFWTLFTLEAAIAISVIIFTGSKIADSWEQHSKEQAKKAAVMEQYNQTVEEFQSVVNFRLPYTVSCSTRWQPDGKEIVITINMEGDVFQKYTDQYPQSCEGVFYVEPITEWELNGESYQLFTQRNEIDGGPRNEVKGRISGYMFEGGSNTWFSLIIKGPDAENMKEICVKLKAKYRGETNERLICGKVEKNT